MATASAIDMRDGKVFDLRPGQALYGLHLKAINVQCKARELLEESFTMWLTRLSCRRADPNDPIVIEVR